MKNITFHPHHHLQKIRITKASTQTYINKRTLFKQNINHTGKSILPLHIGWKFVPLKKYYFLPEVVLVLVPEWVEVTVFVVLPTPVLLLVEALRCSFASRASFFRRAISRYKRSR